MSDGGTPDIPTFPVMVLIGLTVFGLAFISTQELDIPGDGGERDQVVFTSEDIGQVGSANQDFRTVRLGDFNVGEGRGDILAYSSRKNIIEKSLLSGDRIEIDYNATQPREGKVTFEVLGREGPGAVYVEANGRKVFQEKMVSTGEPEIAIPADALKPGMNSIVIGATKGGLISSTRYSIEDVEVRISDRKFNDFEDSFRLYDYELKDFVSSEISFSIASSVKTEPLDIYVNDNQVYSKRQVRVSPEEISLNPGNADLHPGYNSIRFETDGEARYDIENAQMDVRYLGNTQERTLRVEFGANSSSLNFAERDDTDEKIVFDYQRLLPSPRQMVIDLNGNRHAFTPENGRNTVDIESGNLQSSNTMIIRSNTTYQMNNLRVTSEKVE